MARLHRICGLFSVGSTRTRWPPSPSSTSSTRPAPTSLPTPSISQRCSAGGLSSPSRPSARGSRWSSWRPGRPTSCSRTTSAGSDRCSSTAWRTSKPRSRSSSAEATTPDRSSAFPTGRATRSPRRADTGSRSTRRRGLAWPTVSWAAAISDRKRLSACGSALLQDLLRDRERAVRRGQPGVDGGVQDHLRDLVGREAVPECRAYVHRDLVLGPERDESSEGDAAPRPAVEPRTGPDLGPGIACDEVLKGLGERCRALDGTIYVRVAEHLTAHLHALLAVAHAGPPVSRWSRMRPVTASACSTLARCAAFA